MRIHKWDSIAIGPDTERVGVLNHQQIGQLGQDLGNLEVFKQFPLDRIP
jgi:hypothetical protein